MAAVLCETCGDMTKGLCNGICKILTLPCKACGLAFDPLKDAICTPFFPYLGLTFCLNIPGLYFGMRSATFGCYLSTWLFTNGVLCIVHMIASIYVVNKIGESNDTFLTPAVTEGGDVETQNTTITNYKSFATPKQNEQGAANSFARIKHVLCYDKIMAMYILFFIGWIMFLSYGVSVRLEADGKCFWEDEWIDAAISCGYLYLSLVLVAFGCSLCCLR